MNISEEQISEIVNRVVTQYHRTGQTGDQISPQSDMKSEWGVFNEMDDAVEAAYTAFLEFKKLDLQDRKAITDVIRHVGISNKE